MKLIAHRRNTLAELADTPKTLGVEVDIRSIGKLLVTQHEPFVPGLNLELWLDAYCHETLILNVKEEGLEERILEMLAERGIENFFFLDQSFPFLIKWARSGESRAAVRVSEFESLETALALSRMCEWVWVDCFTKFPLSADDAARLKEAGFRLCLASPELHGRDAASSIPRVRSQMQILGVEVDAVCSKRPDIWIGE